MSQKKLTSPHYLWFFFYWLLIVDSINGFFLGLGQSFPLGIAYKSLLLFCLIAIAITDRKNIPSVFLWIGYLCLFLLHFSHSPNAGKIGETLSLLSKFLVVYWGYPVMTKIAKKYPSHTFDKIKAIFLANAIVLVANIILGVMGFGYSSYGDGGDDSTGYRGFFYAINELSGVILVLFGSVLFYAKVAYTNLRYYAVLLFLLFCVAMFSTKTAMGGMLILFIFLQYLFGRKKYLIWITAFLCVLIPLLLYIGYCMAQESGLWDRWMYFYDKSDDFFSFILSGRNVFWENMKGRYLNSGFWGMVVGLGGNLTVEMDPFDALLNFGVIGFVIVYGFWFYMIRQAFKRRKDSLLAKFVLFVDVEILVFSIFAGHLMFSGLLGPFVPLLNALIYIPDKLLMKKIRTNEIQRSVTANRMHKS